MLVSGNQKTREQTRKKMNQQKKNTEDGKSQTGTEPPALVTTSVGDGILVLEPEVVLAENSLERRSSVIFICSWAAISNSIIGLLWYRLCKK